MDSRGSDPTDTIVKPAMIALLVVSGVTGIMMLTHRYSDLVRFAHEWLSVLFIVAALWLLVRNWRIFARSFKRGSGRGAFGIALVASVALTGMTGNAQHVSPTTVLQALSSAPLEKAAPAFGLEPETALAVLHQAGIKASLGDTLSTIGARNGTNGAEIASRLAEQAQASE
ncbi:DUF4405 domain-containing protein [Afifella marina]|uniref:DUF4405 domain-containing protein n=1 Tax=Afifella marina DSM 2698 TaxID=1120955 RepID=A0A1G5NVP6_AFIMA|nr:DUF4405 domain-containing protein [Afifella marina]MBK1624008.1 hypothetical protein [Afifella marina DSM 2698]MBK1627565.1 hypothetical protein [Afifella marina]MBK5916289.1 hypothetical protein [Afifella marina]RAI20863.1 hypothetical protein CH311_07920 [Afifella marina DSM 2698]SCZ41433.1 hypothetical protein SAMN03080610_02770 [Afifella marina DSM 2698]